MASQNTIFRQQQQLYKSSHYFGKPKAPAFYTSAPISPLHQEDLSSKGRKRRASEDELMEDTSVEPIDRTYNVVTPRTKQHDKMLHTIKRNRTGIEKSQQFPLDKLLAPLDKGKLIELISELVEANPRLQPEINEMIQPSQPK